MIEQDPRVTEGPSFFRSLYDWMRRVAISVNGTEKQVATNTASIATKAPIDSPTLTGDPKAPTPANSDNDTSIATTAWVRNAMATIATAAGFAFSFGTTSYLKLPSWLGSWVVQWGASTGSTSAGSQIAVTFPLTFPTTCRAALAVSSSSSTTLALPISTGKSTTGFNAVFVEASGGVGNAGVGAGVSVAVNWIAVGD